ncbi:MAG: idi [Nocardioides sp.]|jgi:isopentenyl-diphosphate delta-isomerase|uniref:isopentenyl-diphosphate Delta-isomerase n=1 Tax=Nocardioides sp. TaxID=35761 RepID=UPI00261D8D4C|nr:isopentenyl-diphosphate Delta-isomerase [Nocardioides sp.]MCW2835334.1 idi [Nocardioides sp.]
MKSESVVLLDEAGRAVGTADKRGVHHAETPLHLAFSVHIFDGRGLVLVTQRALDKATFPGVWSNACCGHPAPGEDLADAVRRRVHEELGLRIDGLRLLLPRFRYRAVQDGTVENEMCPVFVATTSDEVRLDPAEVAEAKWEPWSEFRAAVLDGTRPISQWCREQVEQLPVQPLSAPAASEDDLPPAARGLSAS